ncbi:urea ABC transporter ATP-binding subunit UrtE [Rhodobacter veldkampii DSM 11550]|uniref:Urea ABC transporter ATP-binding subunit UrtE n=1 Tax=Phaeovulum veldkampii DSM 11550 TaxID=1185920 RepID=A0A2T4JG09_9RHOB|nr:urea ABC transporter ATP-binding subunit UrtE [Phaeovulum veldkampii]MBK5945104.1 urea ABC transporter ATP-binding subunit UrtE [Phaeovulum veldkampii DSM 11550]PTE16758.1 urea ABC transporter ATP-binding subunit UrtE [Phaeovulum veldkampii DSM 11550]TDQ64555.1 amino acid/amide ABC transporter ATP-binding protein 2 (HAAT family) [Phaeovulum veldkampii DSM 11550]
MMLKTQGLTLHYGSSQILYGIDMEARAGEVTCVMGTNGVGKTSLLKALAGSHPRSGGRLWLDGEELAPLPAQAMARRGVAVVPQGRMIFPLLTVTENLETGFSVLPRGGHRIPAEIYDLFPVLKDMAQRRGGDLSGGQQQQLAIARAMIMRPRVLLLDEPTEGIQPNIIQQIGRVIDYLRGRGDMAIVLVEQYFDFAYGLADRFYVLKRGAVDLAGTKAELGREAVRASVSV